MEPINVTPYVLSIIGLMGLVLTVRVIPLIKEKLTLAQRESIYAWVKIAVKAAEQLCKDGRLDPKARKDKVMKDVKEWLAKNNIIIDFDEIDKMIEAIVSELPKTFLKDDGKTEEGA